MANRDTSTGCVDSRALLIRVGYTVLFQSPKSKKFRLGTVIGPSIKGKGILVETGGRAKVIPSGDWCPCVVVDDFDFVKGGWKYD